MQFRELSSSELPQGFALLSSLRPELDETTFQTFISENSPLHYRLLGAFQQSLLIGYSGVSLRENLELGRHLIIDDLVMQEGAEYHAAEMIDFLEDYAKIHGCEWVILFGKGKGLTLEDLDGFRPKRDGFIKKV